MGKYSVLFLILQLLKITQVETFTKPCNASLLTVSIVTRCPTDEASYNISARQKNCSSLVDSSSCESFEYHCVLSEDLNSAIEVCAPSFFIIGHACAMFSTTLQSIMRVDNMTCGNDTAGCPFSYHSTTSYKYRHCIPTEKQIYTTEATKRTSNSITKGEIKEQSDDMNSVVIVIVVVILIIGGTATVLLLIYFMRRPRRRRAPEANPVNQNLPQPRGENELQDDGSTNSNHQAMAKIDVDTTEKNKRVMLKCSMNFLTKSLVNPAETWTKDKIKQHVKGMINDLEDAKETDLLIEFIRTIDQDPNIQTTLIKCGVEMFELISSVQQRYNATKVQIINGCVCFVFSFADEKSMEKLLNDFSERGKHFRNCISKILLNQTFLGIFQIHPKTVTWKACELKVYKGAKEVEHIKPEKPGTLKYMLDMEEDIELDDLEAQPMLDDTAEPGLAKEEEDIEPEKPGTLKYMLYMEEDIELDDLEAQPMLDETAEPGLGAKEVEHIKPEKPGTLKYMLDMEEGKFLTLF
ncbi:uncharacterized protein LOC134241776 [Saccostrea cucullata]|uniref:uncharacterized protein LOC134241776 n=1 Tax=Saccostrea cuccullata TaxID=36930 RepID=UPI002ED5FC50